MSCVVTCSLLPDIHSVVAGLVNLKRTLPTLVASTFARGQLKTHCRGDEAFLGLEIDFSHAGLDRQALAGVAPGGRGAYSIRDCVRRHRSRDLARRRLVLSSKRADRRLSDHGDRPGRTAAEENSDALERMVALTIGSRWTPLNETEIAALSTRLTEIPKIRVQIMYENALGKELAQSFYEAFKLAERGGAALGIGSGLGYGVTIGQGSGTATIALKSAIEATSQVKVAIVRPDQPQWPGVVFLAVGINSN